MGATKLHSICVTLQHSKLNGIACWHHQQHTHWSSSRTSNFLPDSISELREAGNITSALALGLTACIISTISLAAITSQHLKHQTAKAAARSLPFL
jgi:hypothetical protein